MKLSTKILATLLILLLGELLSANIMLKQEYDKVDKSDIYWNYEKVLEQPFKYLNITGGNVTSIAFEQSPKYSVRILQEWKRYHNGEIKAHVTNDTLYINFDFIPSSPYEKIWMQGTTTVRIFSPALLSIDGFNTNLEMFKLDQKSIKVNIAGRSKFEVESITPNLDSIFVSQKDSSEVVFEMSPDYQIKPVADPTRVGAKTTFTQQITNKEAMSINAVDANLQGYSLLDLGHAQIQSMHLNIADSSAIILSGGALKKVNSLPSASNRFP